MGLALPVLALGMAACGGRVERQADPQVAPPALALRAVVATDPVRDDPDDPAIWIHPADAGQSLVMGTNKAPQPTGSLAVFDLQGKTLQTITELDRPNNVDIEQNIQWDGESLDIAVVTERLAHRLRIYRIDAGMRRLRELATPEVFTGEQGFAAEPMGIGIFRRRDGAVFLIVGRKSGPATGYLWQYRLLAGGRLELVRKFGAFSGSGEIEAIAVDDALGYVYYADEKVGIRKYHADPDAPDAGRELAVFGLSGYRGDREGLAIYTAAAERGYIVSTDQIAGGSRYFLYRREGEPGAPHDHHRPAAVFTNGADETDGVDATSMTLPGFPRGFLAVMNSGSRNFLLFDWPESPESK